MKVRPTSIPEVLLVEPKVFGDSRGFFYESFNQSLWASEAGLDTRFVQDNHSRSRRGVLRGLHFQAEPMAQGKLVRCVVGEVFDVAVDIRPGSPSFGKWVGEYLSADNCRQLWIPEGFAHGFMVVSEVAEFLYKTTNYYSPEHERAIRWDDPQLGIAWPTETLPSLSEKDAGAPLLSELGL